MIIATYNVNGVNGRLPVLLRWLELRRPDIVCLQELKSPDEKFPESNHRVTVSFWILELAVDDSRSSSPSRLELFRQADHRNEFWRGQ